MRLADYMADFVAGLGVTEVFGITGGGAMYLNDAFGCHPKFTFVASHNEQASSMAAEGYARISGKIGVLQVTTGPGGTNSITGICGAWIDSIPILTISGQVMIKDMVGDANLRQIGVQEVDIISMVKPITKYAVTITEPHMIRYHLEKALHYATTGRPGPVWLDIPLDVQNTDIDPATLQGYEPETPFKQRSPQYLKKQVEKCLAMLSEAERPTIIFGYGVRLADAVEEFKVLADKLQIPLIPTWNAKDFFPAEHPNVVGSAGLFGDRASNFAVQNSDLLLIIGSRMSVPQTGYNPALFAREAKQIMVDIDEEEIIKPMMKPDLPIVADAGEFISELSAEAGNFQRNEKVDDWVAKCRDWKTRYPVVTPDQRQGSQVNSYYFTEQLAEKLPEGSVIVTDMGTSFTCTMQAFAPKKNQRLFTSSGLAAMGFGLPGAIGACFANGGRRTILIAGDGGFMFNIQELQTVRQYNLPITIFILANGGYLAMKLMQENHFKRFVGSEEGSGVSCPDFVEVSRAFGIEAMHIRNSKDLSSDLDKALAADGPFLAEIDMPDMQALLPRVQTQRTPEGKLLPPSIEVMYPFLDREEFLEQMIVPPVEEG
ncbi:MAG: thiamine pyrophosphate-binding protein [Rhodospirillales bacterium]|nr:thiamine pyrophosphate-binding protein [Rhodospirillales bacterium]